VSTRGAESTAARERILGRIREALPGKVQDVQGSHASLARLYRRAGELTGDECVELLIDRLLDYDVEVLQVADESGIADAVADGLLAHGEHSVVAAASFPTSWLPEAMVVVRDTGLSTAELEAQTTVLTTCEVAVASTGTILLVHEGMQGRRAMTLLPDHHVCLVRRDQVVETLGEALMVMAPHARKPMTTISGPSATSDIEMTRIRGVHGPRRLTVILYGGDRAAGGDDGLVVEAQYS
jgi:L-lactate dehydrogenase complex protein LldG